MNILFYILVGVVSGIAGGLFGIGGGTIMIPVMVYILGMSQHLAQGTSLAVMLPPVGFLAVLKYYQHGNVNLKVALWMAVGFLVGGLGGAYLVQPLADPLLKRLFGGFLVLVGLKMVFF